MEPERNIEKLLRAYARKRREKTGAPVELHPATRRLLQGEVARRAPRGGEDSFLLTVLTVLRRRLVLVSCVAAVVLVGTWLFLASGLWKKETTLAFEPERHAAKAAAPVAAPAPAPAPLPLDQAESKSDHSEVSGRRAGHLGERELEVANLNQNRLRGAAAPAMPREEVMTAKEALQPPAPATANGQTDLKWSDGKRLHDSAGDLAAMTNGANVVAVTGVAALKDATAEMVSERVPRPEAGGRLSLAVNAPEAAPSGFDRLEARQRLLADQAASQAKNELPAFVASQRFSQMNAASNLQYRDKRIAAPVLASFQVEQGDRQLRIVDQDGSVYSGYWRPGESRIVNQVLVAQKAPVVAATPPAPFQEKQMPESQAEQESIRNYFFSVAGVNRSLNQNVVFTGNLAVANQMFAFPTNHPATVGGEVGGLQNSTANQSLQLRLSNSRISGRAVIDSSQEIEVNAAPAGP